MKKVLLASLILLLVGLFVSISTASAGTYFAVRCGYSHTNHDDAILDKSGTSHSHDYVGANNAHFGSTYSSMRAGGTTCGTPDDTAGYWEPAPNLGSQVRHPMYARIYYGCGTVACSTIQTPPANMMVIGGNVAATSPNIKQEKYDCGQNTPLASYPYNCTDYYRTHPGLTDSSNDGVVAWAVMPQWWDGVVGSTSCVHCGAQPKDFSYTKTGSFTHPLPLITIRYHLGHAWDTCLPNYTHDPLGMPTCLTFGGEGLKYWQEHGDFWNTWNQTALNTEVHNCLVVQPNSCKSFVGTH